MTHALPLELIERTLAANRVSVAAVCRRAGISQTTWSRWKQGRQPHDRTKHLVQTALSALLPPHVVPVWTETVPQQEAA